MGLRSDSLAAVAVAVALASATVLTAAPAPGENALCGNPRLVQETLFLRQQRVLRDPDVGQPGGARAEPSRQVGDIAIIEASPEIVASPNPFDLAGQWIAITPGQAGFDVSPSRSPVQGAIEDRGLPLELGDDEFTGVELPFLFRFYGTGYSRAFVHSDGYLTLGRPAAYASPRTYSVASAGPPLIAPLFTDLDPGAGGRVRFEPSWFRVTVTWHGVPLHSGGGSTRPQTFQLVLHAGGAIEFRYGDVEPESAVVGIFPGDPARPAEAVDWSAADARIFDGASILAEVFGSSPALDEFAVAQAFFRSREDAYDSLIVFGDIDAGADGHGLAHAYTVRNEVLGIGADKVDAGQLLGSPRRLSAFVNMGSLAQYPDDPLQPIPGLPHSTTLSVLAHEVGHRFLAYPSFLDPETGLPSRSLLGRQLAHWSFFFNSEASVMEGNAIDDRGVGSSPRFVTVAASENFSPLDQYLMGFRVPAEVPPTFLVENPRGPGRLGPPERLPEVGVAFDGIRKEVLVGDIIAVEGIRRPDASVSQRRFRQAFALVVPRGEAPDPDAVAKLQRLRAAWHDYFEEQLEARATVASDLVRMLHLSTWPAGGLVSGSQGRAGITIDAPRETDLTVRLTLAEAIASAPRTVTIPAGGVHAEFAIEGLDPGTTSLTAEAEEPGFDRPTARLSVRSGLEGLVIERIHPAELHGVSGRRVPFPLRFRVRDENLVPYSGVALQYKASGDGAPIYLNTVTDASGVASMRWWLTKSPEQQTLTASLRGAPEISSVTQASAAPGYPAFERPGLVNAASLEAPGSGLGYAPGSLLTIHGSGLSLEEQSADPFLLFGNLSLPYELGGVRVRVGGVAAPVVSVSPERLTFQLPYEVRPPYTHVRVAAPYGQSLAVRIPISPAQPGIFPDRVSGGVHAARVGTRVYPGGGGSLPRAGGLLEVFCTGLGAVDPPGRTGRPGLTHPFQRVVGETRAWVDDRELNVSFSGLVSFEAGLYAVVLDLPEDLEPGAHSVRITVDGVESNTVPFESE